ncbi:Outer membrane protein TolC [Modicisalibacter xianhensis]|uniref:Outer membrane protein TolC n=2 Tax=Modicisalibacter xianhensis TaxID=442341 RepID=A0A1I3GIQ5_9GAMM|nr:Outer membrane protein TolC [Halomonas xianhensis]
MAHQKNSRILSMWWLIGTIGLVGLESTAWGSNAQAAPLTFYQAVALAERGAPDLAAKAVKIESTHALLEPADALPDPKLMLGISNYPVSGPEAGSLNDSAMTMRRIGIAQAIPNSAKRRARREIASAELGQARAQAQVVRLQVRQEAAQAWLTRFYVEQKLTLLDELDRENALLHSTVNAMIASGRAPLTDGVLASQDAARLADSRDALEGEQVAAVALLRRYVNEAADEPLLGSPPSFSLSPQALRDQVLQYPDVLELEASMRTAEARVLEAQSQRRPDWGVELAWQQRDERYGDMISAQISFDLPLFAATRQDPTIRARQLSVEQLTLERDALLSEQARELDSQLADYATLSSQFHRAQSTWVKLAEQRVDLQYAAYINGDGDLGAVLAARRDLINQRLRVFDLAFQRDLLAMRLTFAYGEPAQ